MNERIRFTDGDGKPVSHEYFETIGYTEGLQLDGQLLAQIKTKKGVLVMCARANDEEDFIKLGKLLYKEYMRENV